MRHTARLACAAVLLSFFDAAACIAFSSYLHGWCPPQRALFASWLSELRAWTSSRGADLVLLSLIRCAANCLSAFAFPTKAFVPPRHASALDELNAVFKDTAALLRREAGPWSVCFLAAIPAAWTVLRCVENLSSARANAAGSARLLGFILVSLALCAATLAFVALCSKAAARERQKSSSTEMPAHADPLREPLLSAEEAGERSSHEASAANGGAAPGGAGSAEAAPRPRTGTLWRLCLLSAPDAARVAAAFASLVAAVCCDVASAWVPQQKTGTSLYSNLDSRGASSASQSPRSKRTH